MGKLFKLLAAVGIAAYAIKNKDKVAGLLGGGPSQPEPYTPPGPAPAPAVANADVAGPPENTATAVPAPEPLVVEGSIDEQAEEDAAAAEAANIGGPDPAYTDAEGMSDPAAAPIAEAGGGESEGQELAEADLVENAEPAAGDPIEAERQIDEVIEAQDDPGAGETVAETASAEIPPPPTGDPVDLAPPPDIPAPPAPPEDDKSTTIWKSEEQPTVEQPRVSEDDKP